MSAGTTLTRLVDEFVATMRAGGLAIDRRTVEEEMRDRIAEIAAHLRIEPSAVLREHARAGWGRDMAAAVLAQVRGEEEACLGSARDR